MPSEVVLNSKKEYVAKIADEIRSSGVGILISYDGIDVKTDLRLRKELREAGIRYFVAKNSMLRFAFKEVGYDFDSYLSGSTALAVAEEDPILVSKILAKYVKELEGKGNFFVKSGFLNGNIVGAELINRYGSLPTKEELYSMLLNILMSPIRSFAVVIKEIVAKKSVE